MKCAKQMMMGLSRSANAVVVGVGKKTNTRVDIGLVSLIQITSELFFSPATNH